MRSSKLSFIGDLNNLPFLQPIIPRNWISLKHTRKLQYEHLVALGKCGFFYEYKESMPLMLASFCILIEKRKWNNYQHRNRTLLNKQWVPHEMNLISLTLRSVLWYCPDVTSPIIGTWQIKINCVDAHVQYNKSILFNTRSINYWRSTTSLHEYSLHLLVHGNNHVF